MYIYQSNQTLAQPENIFVPQNKKVTGINEFYNFMHIFWSPSKTFNFYKYLRQNDIKKSLKILNIKIYQKFQVRSISYDFIPRASIVLSSNQLTTTNHFSSYCTVYVYCVIYFCDSMCFFVVLSREWEPVAVFFKLFVCTCICISVLDPIIRGKVKGPISRFNSATILWLFQPRTRIYIDIYRVFLCLMS